eukprot:3640498-Rhodomonas_salina.2
MAVPVSLSRALGLKRAGLVPGNTPLITCITRRDIRYRGFPARAHGSGFRAEGSEFRVYGLRLSLSDSVFQSASACMLAVLSLTSDMGVPGPAGSRRRWRSALRTARPAPKSWRDSTLRVQIPTLRCLCCAAPGSESCDRPTLPNQMQENTDSVHCVPGMRFLVLDFGV